MYNLKWHAIAYKASLANRKVFTEYVAAAFCVVTYLCELCEVSKVIHLTFQRNLERISLFITAFT